MKLHLLFLIIIFFSCTANNNTGISGNQNQHNQIIIADNIDLGTPDSSINELSTNIDSIKSKVNEINTNTIPTEDIINSKTFKKLTAIEAREFADYVIGNSYTYSKYLNRIDTILYKDFFGKRYIVAICNEDRIFVLRSLTESDWTIHLIHELREDDNYISFKKEDTGFKCGGPELVSVANRPFLYYNTEAMGNRGGSVWLFLASLSVNKTFEIEGGGTYTFDTDDPIIERSTEPDLYFNGDTHEKYAYDFLQYKYTNCESFTNGFDNFYSDYKKLKTKWLKLNYKVKGSDIDLDNPEDTVQFNIVSSSTNPLKNHPKTSPKIIDNNQYTFYTYFDGSDNPTIVYDKIKKFYFLLTFDPGTYNCNKYEIRIYQKNIVQEFHTECYNDSYTFDLDKKVCYLTKRH